MAWQCRHKQRSRICSCQVSWDWPLWWTFFWQPLCLVHSMENKCLSLISSRNRLMRLKSGMPSQVTELSFEKKASATIGMDIEFSLFLSELLVLKYCPTREFGLSIYFKYSGTRPRLFLLNICFAIKYVRWWHRQEKSPRLQTPLHWRSVAWLEVSQNWSLFPDLLMCDLD